MTDPWQRREPDSPCTKVCVIHPEAKLCLGCYRTMGEISQWANMTNEKRIALMQELPERAGQLVGKRRGGRRRTRDKSNDAN